MASENPARCPLLAEPGDRRSAIPLDDPRRFAERYVERCGIVALDDLFAVYRATFPGNRRMPGDLALEIHQGQRTDWAGANYAFWTHNGREYLVNGDFADLLDVHEPRRLEPHLYEGAGYGYGARLNDAAEKPVLAAVRGVPDEGNGGRRAAGSDSPAAGEEPPGNRNAGAGHKGPRDADGLPRDPDALSGRLDPAAAPPHHPPRLAPRQLGGREPATAENLERWRRDLVARQSGIPPRIIDVDDIEADRGMDQVLERMPAYRSLQGYLHRTMPRARRKFDRLRDRERLDLGLLEIARSICGHVGSEAWTLPGAVHYVRLCMTGLDPDRLDAPIEPELADRLRELFETLPLWELNGWSRRELEIRDRYAAARQAGSDAKLLIARAKAEYTQLKYAQDEQECLRLQRLAAYEDRLEAAQEHYGGILPPQEPAVA